LRTSRIARGGEAIDAWIDVGAVVRVDADDIGEGPVQGWVHRPARQPAHLPGPDRRREEQEEEPDPTHARSAIPALARRR